MKLRLCASLLALVVLHTATAQDLATRLATDNPAIDAAYTGHFSVEVDALTFFKDNEFEGDHAKGYTLPGMRLQPVATYQPLPEVRLTAGLSALIFDGANKYPCYAYHDIGRWKGNQYQRGAHVLPFFRAEAKMGAVQAVMGNIYGGSNHHVLGLLYNPELALTQDPEAGFQLLVTTKRYSLDAWVNWQSYIFEEDTHQEAFTVGLVQRLSLTPKANRWHVYVPIDVLVQHRGGEQDVTDMGVQTLVNAGAGLGISYKADGTLLRAISMEAALVGSWQQSGTLWPHDTGWGTGIDIHADLPSGFHLQAGFLAARRFVGLYTVPFHSTLSLKHHSSEFSHVAIPHAALEWCRAFSDDYQLGFKLDFYPSGVGRRSSPDGSNLPSAWQNNFSFGAYFRCHPRWRL